MSRSITKVFFIFIICFLTFSCSDNLNDTSKKSEGYSWFINYETGEGEWFKFDGSGVGPSYGRVIEFYTDGITFMEYNLDEYGDMDSIHYYNPSGVEFGHSFLEQGERRYVFENGPIEFFMHDKSKAISASFEDEIFQDIKVHGWYGDIMNAQLASVNISRSFVDFIAGIKNHLLERNALKKITESDIQSIDSMRRRYFIVLDSFELNFNQGKQKGETLDEFYESVRSMKETIKKRIKVDLDHLITMMKKDWDDTEESKAQALFLEIVNTPSQYWDKEKLLRDEMRIEYRYTEDWFPFLIDYMDDHIYNVN